MFRMAKLEDIPHLVTLRVLMQCEIHAMSPSQVKPEFLTAASDYFREAMENRSYFSAVAEVDGKLVSANGLVLYKKPPSLDSFGCTVGYVSNVFTLPEFRRQGMALKLMELLIDQARSLGLMKLHLGATADGKGVYERAGFGDVKFSAMELRF